MDGGRFLIVNADDFGQTPGVNRGVVTCHEHGIVTSASLMVRWPAAAEAAAYARDRPGLSVGLHFDLGEWAYRDGEWVLLYEVARPDDRTAVAREAARQLAAFRELVGRDPSHLDSHQHVHREEPARSVLQELARGLGVPLRHFSPAVRYRGDFYGQAGKGWPYPEGIRVEALVALLRSLPPGTTELGCHPGEGDDAPSMYRHERALEVQTLCDSRARGALAAEGIALCSFRDVRA